MSYELIHPEIQNNTMHIQRHHPHYRELPCTPQILLRMFVQMRALPAALTALCGLSLGEADFDPSAWRIEAAVQREPLRLEQDESGSGDFIEIHGKSLKSFFSAKVVWEVISKVLTTFQHRWMGWNYISDRFRQ